MLLDEQQLIKNYLSEYFFKVQSKNPRFSLRAFAQKLGVSSSSLSEILRSKRKLSKSKALTFAKILRLPEKQVQILTEAFDKAGSLERLKPVANPLKEIVLAPHQFHIMGDRKYFTVLAMLRSSMNSLGNISTRLGLKESEVKSILDDLSAIGVLHKKNGEYFEKEKVVFRTSEEFPEELLRKRRLQNLEACASAIKENRDGERGYFATVSVDKGKLDQIGPIVEDFVKRLSLFLRKPGSQDIFEVNVDIFPWTKP